MKTSSKELKRLSRLNLMGHYPTTIFAFLYITFFLLAIKNVFSSVLGDELITTMQKVIYYTSDFLISLLGVILSVGQMHLHLNIARKKEFHFNNIFYGFRNQPDRFIIAGIVFVLLDLPVTGAISLLTLSFNESGATSTLFVILAVVLFAVAVILNLSFQLTYYLLIDDKEISILKSFLKSMRLMKGYKLRFLYLSISFIGLYLLGILSLGIGFLWIYPYYQQTFANFYLDIIGERQAIDLSV